MLNFEENLGVKTGDFRKEVTYEGYIDHTLTHKWENSKRDIITVN